MTTIVTRAGKGSPLTNTEMDTNLTNLNSYKVEQDISGNATITGDVYLTGSGKRITGDFSNATIANRVMFQTTSANNSTAVGVLPNGSGANAHYMAFSTADPANCSFAMLSANYSNDTRLSSDKTGAGTYLPMTFHTGGSERMRIDANGNTNVGMSGGASKFNVLGNVELRGAQNGTATAVVAFLKGADGTQAGYWGYGSTTSPMEYVNSRGTGHVFNDNGVERLRIDPSGNVWVSSPGGLGYGTGAGGTVTQATSKSTAVTLNKPTGQITMNNAALAAGGFTEFLVNNSLFTVTDIVIAQQLGWSNYRVESYPNGPGSFKVRVTNISGGSLSDAVVINFAVIKGATS